MQKTLFVVTFLFIYGWKITSIADLVFITSILLSLYVFLFMKFGVPTKLVNITLPLFLLMIYGLFILIINGETHTHLVERTFRTIVNLFGGYALVTLYYLNNKKNIYKKVIFHLFLSILVHAIIMLLMYQFDSLRTTVYSVTNAYSIVNLNYPFLNGLRITGITYGLASTSVLQMFGLILSPWIFKLYGEKTINKILIVISLFIIFYSIVLSGNTGVLFSLILMPLMLLTLFLGKRFKKNSMKGLFDKAVLIIILIITFILIVPFSNNNISDYNSNKVYEVIEVFTKGGETPTTETVSAMYNLPDNAITFLFGRGVNGWEDVGWIKYMEYVGVIGTFLMIIPYLYSIFIAIKTAKYNKLLGLTTLFILCGSILLHFKEIGLYNRNAWSVQVILICLCIFYLDRKEK